MNENATAREGAAVVVGIDGCACVDGRDVQADELLPTEQRASDRIDDAAYWSRVYTELLGCTERLLAQTREAMVTVSDVGARSDALSDETSLAGRAARYQRRLAYWRGRGATLAECGTAGDDPKPSSLIVPPPRLAGTFES